MTAFTTIRTVGAALPADVLAATVSDAQLKGLTADDYHLEYGVTPREAANRAWSVLTGAWQGYREAVGRLPEADRAVGITREKWLAVVLRELGFGRVPTTPAGGLTADGRTFPISHAYDLTIGQVPLHLLGWGISLDTKTPGQPGAADRAPHAMVQEYLNRADDALWAMISNGRILRLIRDSSTLIGQSYVEFDLESMFDGEVFSDFVVLYLVCHASRFEPDLRDDATQADCWLERWRSYAAETGTRALQALSPGVKQAIEALGTGFLRHPANDLHHRLGDGALTAKDVHEALLRLVYRLLFCFVAEDRGLLLDPNGSAQAKQRYMRWFSTARLRRISTRRRGSAHPDLWQALSLVLDGLGKETGRPELALPGLGGLFDTGEIDVVVGRQLANEPLLTAIRHLTVVQPAGGGPKRVIDYRNLGAEELGSVYESLLEFVPRYDPHTRTFTLESVVGNDRKTSGAYYTPTSLIDCLLDSALDPLLDEADRASDPEEALLSLTVCDPACGSGHFLVASAKRIAARLATVRARSDGQGTDEPTILEEQRAMHDVVDRCIYGVDLNPMAAELAKVSLWLESVQPGRALSFLDAHVKVGNALLGTTPALLAAGLPDAAFTALAGDDKKVVSSLRRRNKQEREGQGNLFGHAGISVSNAALAQTARQMDAMPNTTLADVHLAQQRFRAFDTSPELRKAKAVADAWCAAFVSIKASTWPEITHATIERLADGNAPDPATAAVLTDLSAQYRFFHWHLEFPQIFNVTEGAVVADGPGWQGGFACVVGNPPWERIKLQEQEFFAALDPAITGAQNAAARRRMIVALVDANPALHQAYEAAKRRADGDSQLLRLSGRFPLCGRGDVNSYPLFAEHGTNITSPGGRLGIITPTGIATDNYTQEFFRSIVEQGRLRVFYDFLNNDRLFYGVGNRTFKFCILVVSGDGDAENAALFGSFLAGPATLAEPGRQFTMTNSEIARINPNTRTCPLFRTRADAQILLAIHDRLPILRSETHGLTSGWEVRYQTSFHMSGDSSLFFTTADLVDEGATRVRPDEFVRPDGSSYRPLVEGKMFNLFDSRWGDYALRAEGVNDSELPRVSPGLLDDPTYCNSPRYWVPRAEIAERLGSRWSKPWLIAFRDVARSYNERTIISCVLPPYGVGHTAPLIQFDNPTIGASLFLSAMLSSYVTDWCLRLRQGGTHLTYGYVNQIPVIPRARLSDQCPWSTDVTIEQWFTARAWELLYTSEQHSGAAAERQDTRPPFRWMPDRRESIRNELDAGFFHLYGLTGAELQHVMQNFHVVLRKDTELHGTFRTLERILAVFERLAATTTYVSDIRPTPGDGPRH